MKEVFIVFKSDSDFDAEKGLEVYASGVQARGRAQTLNESWKREYSSWDSEYAGPWKFTVVEVK